MIWNIGIIGAGYISETHLKAWMRQPNAKLSALCDINPEALNKRARQFGIPADKLYTDIDQMLASADIDIVDITTGPDTHLTLVKKAAAAGKHLLCQKPFAPDLNQAKEMIQAAQEAGVRLMVTENWRWQSSIQNVKHIMESGILGQVYFAKYNTLHYFTPMLTPEKEIQQPYFRTMPRLLMYEMGTHWFDVWRFLFGEPDRLYAELRSVSPYVAGDDVGTILLGHKHFHGLMDMSWASRRGKGSELMFIETDRNSLRVSGDGTAILHDNNGEQTLNGPLPWDYEESFCRLQAHFIECLENGRPFQTSAEDNLKTLRLSLAAYESSQKREVIRF